MKAAVKRILIFLLSASLLLLPGCADEPEEKAPSNYEQLHGLLGKSVHEVCETLGIDQAQAELALEGKGLFPALGEAQYAGLTWTAYPLFDRFDKTLYGFEYTVGYTDNPDQAAPIFIDLVAALAEDYGEPLESNDTVMFDGALTAENILNTIWNRKKVSADQHWQLNHEITPEIQSYCDRLLAEYDYPSGLEDWAVTGLDYGMLIQYSAGLDSASFKLTYRLTSHREYVGPSREERQKAQAEQAARQDN